VPAKTKHSTNVKVIAGIFVSKSNYRKSLITQEKIKKPQISMRKGFKLKAIEKKLNVNCN
jgi:hypothetical protein